MNKQQLAAKIWESANQMRSKIEANEYKDYILGFIFYKYLSEKQVQYALSNDFTEEDIQQLKETDEETVEYFKKNIGYFIAYDHLFSTWIEKGADFEVDNVRIALSAFSRLIDKNHQKLFSGIFETLETGLSKLGDSAASQTKAISGLLQLIKNIPMDGKQDYDVLGFIYEYLIEKFAANAGKKAGEFYTPHEVSLLMSEIVADHLRDREKIQIYDSCSGSGSLLINIGNSVSKHLKEKNNIKYFAQELKKNTYNLTRMNLVMRGILLDNIATRNGDTLEDDWPYFEENDPIRTYNALYVDAVVSNPPYSQKWDPSNKEADPRYARFGLAPKSKADYAFLLHDLYHLKPDGIMTIVLPHGVLFRGGEEKKIRQQLIESNHVDAIIGLPPSIFFGTGIPTVIIVLKQKRANTDVLVIDASRGFVKDGKNNKLRAADIQKIVDAVHHRNTIEKYAQVVSRATIRANEYNLNIPRYVDAAPAAESWDIYAAMFGGLPANEITTLDAYWAAFPHLKAALFVPNTTDNLRIAVPDVQTAIKMHPSVQSFVNNFEQAFGSLADKMEEALLTNIMSIQVPKQKNELTKEVFERLEGIPLVDKYEAYQLLHDHWETIKIDIEIIQTEGWEATKVVDPNMILKKVRGKEQEVQDGWIGRVLPFELVQQTYLKQELQVLQQKQTRLATIPEEYETLIDSLEEEDKDTSILNDANDAFVPKEVQQALKEIFAEVASEEINALQQYLQLSQKAEKEAFVQTHTAVQWQNIPASKNGTYSKTAVNKYIAKLQTSFEFEVDTLGYVLVQATKLMAEEKQLKSAIKKETASLHLTTKDTIESLTDEQVYQLLQLKWVAPLVDALQAMPTTIIQRLTQKVTALAAKYQTTYAAIHQEIKQAENTLAELLGDLSGNEADMQGLQAFQASLKKSN